MAKEDFDLGLRLPAMKGEQGGRTMYLCLPSNKMIGERFSKDPETEGDSKAQRDYEPRRAEEIKEYMGENIETYVLGALTYAMDTEGRFQPTHDSLPVGILSIPSEATVRCIDGQHRCGAIKGAVNELSEVAKDNTALLIYVEPELSNRKQMFSDMNSHQKRVNSSVNIDFNSRDLFARVAQHLAASHPLLKNRVERKKASVAKTSPNLFTLGAVYDAMGRLCTGAGGRLRDREKFGPEDRLSKLGNEFFDWVAKRPEFEKVLRDPDLTIPMRESTILLSSTTLKMLASAVHIVRRQHPNIKLKELIDPFLAIDFKPKARIWQDSGFVSRGKRTPNARLQEIKAAADEVAKLLAPPSTGA